MALPHWFFTLLPLVLIGLAILFFWVSGWLQGQTGLPDGKIIYSDTGRWGKTAKPLYDAELGLTGKPDYLIRKNGIIIPVEVKSTWAPPAPYESHKLQLAAYCLLVQGYFGLRPPYGLLRYRNRTFRIVFNPELEEQVREVVEDIRLHKEQDEACRSHDHPNRCARCGYRGICDQRL